MGSVVYALEYMHERNIVFRDLKPENMMLSGLGKMRMCDFGLAKVTVEKTYTCVGTPEYFAPEVLTGKGHLHEVDWWTAGIVTFELMTGHTPFASENDDPQHGEHGELFQRIRRGMDLMVFPEEVSGPCEDFVRALTQLLPTERLPMKEGGIDNIKTHPFFGDFHWAALLDETLVPPHIPVVRGRRDTGNFSLEDLTPTRLPPKLAYKDYDDGSNWDVDFATSM
jgi:protein kinase X